MNLDLGEDDNLADESLALCLSKCKEAGEYVHKASLTVKYKPLLMKAIDSYSEAITLYPYSPEPYLALASICWQFGKPAEARGLLNQLLEFSPSHKKAVRMLKAIEKQLGDQKAESPEKDLKKVNQFNFDISKKFSR